MKYVSRGLFGDDDGEPEQHVMLACPAGHVVTDSIELHGEKAVKFCGEHLLETFSACKNCGTPLRGRVVWPNGYYEGVRDVPKGCGSCGMRFPWTVTEVQAAAEAAFPVEKTLERIFNRFTQVARPLSRLRKDKHPFLITDEYDVQALLESLLRVFYEDVVREDPTPIHAGQSAHVDFYLPHAKAVTEVKMTRATLKDKEVGNELLVDIAKKGCERLFCFVYDPGGHIVNAAGLARDLEQSASDQLDVRVFVRS